MTFVAYAAIGGVFFLLVIALQVVAGFSPLAAGISPLPVTAAMHLLAAFTIPSSLAAVRPTAARPRLPA